MTILEKQLAVCKQKGAAYWVLIDPDKLPSDNIPAFVKKAETAGVDGILIGGSLILSSDFEKFVAEFKQQSPSIPVILFPGSVHQITPHADAMLFISLISGREAQHLIGSQVLAAPLVYRTGLETIATAYMLLDSGRPTSAHFMSGTMPIPRDKPDIVVAHALAAQYLGFRLIYLEGGSGSELTIPDEVITAVTGTTNLPVIVGGGIKTPEAAANKVKAGASFIVTGNVIESPGGTDLMIDIARAVHTKQ
jgi:phosphoglycerol geranylgeranyltransferase